MAMQIDEIDNPAPRAEAPLSSWLPPAVIAAAVAYYPEKQRQRNTDHWRDTMKALKTKMGRLAGLSAADFEFRLPEDGCQFRWRFFWGFIPVMRAEPVGWSVDLIEHLQKLGYQVKLVCSWWGQHVDGTYRPHVLAIFPQPQDGYKPTHRVDWFWRDESHHFISAVKPE
jgi:hypothetical protein